MEDSASSVARLVRCGQFQKSSPMQSSVLSSVLPEDGFEHGAKPDAACRTVQTQREHELA
jgi:hypothetical protein